MFSSKGFTGITKAKQPEDNANQEMKEKEDDYESYFDINVED